MIQTPLHSVCYTVLANNFLYLLTDGKGFKTTSIYRGVWKNIQIAYLQFVDNIIGVESSAILY